MRIVFMGTPDIAATCLKRILDDGFDVVGVYTQPDRPKGRGMKMVFSPVKELALANNIPVFQPENFRGDEDVQVLRDLKPDVCAVVAYGRILPQRVLDIATLGNVNIHASLLPQYRGSAPYQWAGWTQGNRCYRPAYVAEDGCRRCDRCSQDPHRRE